MATGSREWDAAGDLLDWGTWGFTSTDMTLACWVYFDSFPASVDGRLISKANGTSAAAHDWMIGYSYNSGSPVARCRIANTAGTAVGSTTLSTGQWYHIAAVLDDASGEMRVYVDGVEDGSTGNASNPSTSTNGIYVGNQPTSATSAPRGRIADAAVWSTLLSDANIASLAALTTRPDDYPTGLEGYLSGSDLTDSSGNGRDATNTNTTAEAADPGFSSGTEISGTVDTLSLTENQATVNASNQFSATSVSKTLAGLAASISLNLAASSDSFTIAAQQAGVTSSSSIAATADTFSIAAQSATIGAGTSIDATSVSLTIDAPDLSLSYDLRADSVSLGLTANSASINAGSTISATSDGLTISANQASVNAANNFAATLGTFSLVENSASINSALNVSAAVDELTITANSASINGAQNIEATTDALSISAQSASVSAGSTFNGSVVSLSLSENAASVSIDVNISATCESLSIVAQAALTGTSSYLLGTVTVTPAVSGEINVNTEAA